MRAIDKLLIKAIIRNDTGAIAKTLAGGADPNLAADGGTPLLTIAALQGKRDVVDLLLDAGADMNISDRYGVTPLHVLAGFGMTDGHDRVLDRLIERGIDVNQSNHQGFTPLDFSASLMNTHMAEKLQRAGAVCRQNQNLLHEILRGGDTPKRNR